MEAECTLGLWWKNTFDTLYIHAAILLDQLYLWASRKLLRVQQHAVDTVVVIWSCDWADIQTYMLVLVVDLGVGLLHLCTETVHWCLVLLDYSAWITYSVLSGIAELVSELSNNLRVNSLLADIAAGFNNILPEIFASVQLLFSNIAQSLFQYVSYTTECVSHLLAKPTGIVDLLASTPEIVGQRIIDSFIFINKLNFTEIFKNNQLLHWLESSSFVIFVKYHTARIVCWCGHQSSEASRGSHSRQCDGIVQGERKEEEEVDFSSLSIVTVLLVVLMLFFLCCRLRRTERCKSMLPSKVSVSISYTCLRNNSQHYCFYDTGLRSVYSSIY